MGTDLLSVKQQERAAADLSYQRDSIQKELKSGYCRPCPLLSALGKYKRKNRPVSKNSKCAFEVWEKWLSG